MGLLLLFVTMGAAPAEPDALLKALRKGTRIDRTVACPDKHVQLLELTHPDEPASPKALAVAVEQADKWVAQELVHFRDGEEGNSWGGCKQLGGHLVYWNEFWSVAPEATGRDAQRKIPGVSVYVLDGSSSKQLVSESPVPKGKVDVTADGERGVTLSIGGKKIAGRGWEG